MALCWPLYLQPCFSAVSYSTASLILLAIVFNDGIIVNMNQLRRRPSAGKLEAKPFIMSTT